MVPPSLPITASLTSALLLQLHCLHLLLSYKSQIDSASRKLREDTVYLAAATNIGKLQMTGTNRRWESNSRHPPPIYSRSTVRCTNRCATEPVPKKNGLNKTYIASQLPQHGSLARWYHCRWPTII